MGWRKTETKNATTWQATDTVPMGWPSPQAQRGIGTSIVRGTQQPNSLPFSRMSREEPTQIATVESHFTVPLLWALATGGFAALVVLPLFILFAPDAFWVALWIGAVAAGIMWLNRMWGLDIVLWKAETIIGRDVTGDGVVGRPEATVIHARVEHEDRKPQDLFLEFDLPKETVIELARAALADSELKKNKIILPEREWKGRVSPDKLRTFKHDLVKFGLAEWKDAEQPHLGCKLTKAGKGTLRACVLRACTPEVQNQDGSAEEGEG